MEQVWGSEMSGRLLVYSNSRNVAHLIQQGIQTHYGLLANVTKLDNVTVLNKKLGTKWAVFVVTKMRQQDYLLAQAYATAVIDVCAKFKLDTDRIA